MENYALLVNFYYKYEYEYLIIIYEVLRQAFKVKRCRDEMLNGKQNSCE